MTTKVNASSLATVATSGSYNDLSSKPTIPAAQINSDWSALSGLAQIKNKPTLAAVASSGSYTDLTSKPTIPTVPTAVSAFSNDSGYLTSTSPVAAAKVTGLAAVATSGSYTDLSSKPTIPAAQVNSDWSAASGAAQILNKPTIPAVVTFKVNGTNTGSQSILNAKAGANMTITDDGVGGLTFTSAASGGSTSWGAITGTLANQTDLSTALNGKANSSALATVATSGSYADLLNIPTIPAAQIETDWNASTGLGVLLNKPTIPTVPSNVSAFTNDAGYLTPTTGLAANGTTVGAASQAQAFASGVNVGAADNSLGGNLVAYSTLGPELAPALSGASGTNWTFDSTWTVAGGTAQHTTNGATTLVPTSMTLTVGTVYRVSVTASAVSVGSFSFGIGGSNPLTTINSGNLSSTIFQAAQTTASIVITPTSTARFTISSISIKALATTQGGVTADGSVQTRTVLGFLNSAGVLDTGISRSVFTPGAIQIGNGTFGSSSGSLGCGTLTANTIGQASSTFILSGAGCKCSSSAIFSFSASASAATADTALSRISPGVIAIGNGTAGNASGTLNVGTIAATSINASAVQTFGAAQPGVVSASGGGTTNFLRADGTWAAPSSSGAAAIPTIPRDATWRRMIANQGTTNGYDQQGLAIMPAASGVFGIDTASGLSFYGSAQITTLNVSVGLYTKNYYIGTLSPMPSASASATLQFQTYNTIAFIGLLSHAYAIGGNVSSATYQQSSGSPFYGFRFIYGTDTTWKIHLTSGGSDLQVIDTGVAFDYTKFHTFDLIYNASAGTLTFGIDGVVVGGGPITPTVALPLTQYYSAIWAQVSSGSASGGVNAAQIYQGRGY